MRARRLRDAILRRLRETYRETMASVAAEYGVAPVQIDLSPQSRQVFQGQLTADQVDETVAARYPLLIIYAVSSANEHSQMPAAFAGVVTIAVEWHLSYRGGNAPRDSETACDVVEDAMYRIFQNGNWPQLYGAGNAVMFGIECARSPIDMAGEHWRQTVRFTLQFEVAE